MSQPHQFLSDIVEPQKFKARRSPFTVQDTKKYSLSTKQKHQLAEAMFTVIDPKQAENMEDLEIFQIKRIEELKKRFGYFNCLSKQ